MQHAASESGVCVAVLNFRTVAVAVAVVTSVGLATTTSPHVSTGCVQSVWLCPASTAGGPWWRHLEYPRTAPRGLGLISIDLSIVCDTARYVVANDVLRVLCCVVLRYAVLCCVFSIRYCHGDLSRTRVVFSLNRACIKTRWRAALHQYCAVVIGIDFF